MAGGINQTQSGIISNTVGIAMCHHRLGRWWLKVSIKQQVTSRQYCWGGRSVARCYQSEPELSAHFRGLGVVVSQHWRNYLFLPNPHPAN